MINEINSAIILINSTHHASALSMRTEVGHLFSSLLIMDWSPVKNIFKHYFNRMKNNRANQKTFIAFILGNI